jgi:hypothetical protein
MKKRLSLFIILAIISGILYVPFIKAHNSEMAFTTWFIFPLASGLGIFIFGWLGFKFADKSDLTMPILNKWENNEHISRVDFEILKYPIIFSIVFALAVFGVNQFFDTPKNPGNILIRILTTPWAGTVTETISHLFVMSGIYLLIKNRWASIIISSLIFLVIFHLNGVDGDISMAIYLGIMNFSAATLTGWFYSKYGFESAVVGHSVMHLIMLALN